MAKKTKDPTGLVITRDGFNFKCTWKLPQKYDAQFGKIQTFGGNKKYLVKDDISLDPTSKSMTYKLSASRLYPTGSATIQTVRMYVKAMKVFTESRTFTYKKGGKKHKDTVKVPIEVMSDWAHADFVFYAPKAPTGSAALTDNIEECKFSWSVPDSGSGTHYHAAGTVYESILANSAETNTAKIAGWFKSGATGWQRGTAGLSGSVTIRENHATLAGKNMIRWVRVKSRGMVGESGWTYFRHAYGAPKKAKIDTKNTWGKANSAGGTDVKVTWVADQAGNAPIDEVTVQYVVCTPGANLACPPGTTGWNDIATLKDTGANGKADAITRTIDDAPDENECMYVRVVTKHDDHETESDPCLVRTGVLSAPENLSVSVVSATHRATVTATNTATDIPDSFLVITYTSDAEPEGFVIAVIEHGATSVQVQCPDWGSSPPSFSVYACVGSKRATPRADGITSYAVTARAKSAVVTDGGSVPCAPENVRVTPTTTPGTVRVTWEWSWMDADIVEISWSDHADAWESTDEPSTYEISNLYNSAWNIAGLETGVVWYIRMRMGQRSDDDKVTWSAYSELDENTIINLSSAPAIPSLQLSTYVATVDSNVRATWAYSSTDGTGQASAVLAEVTEEGGQTVYTEIAHTESAQYVLLDVDRLGWAAGETHDLAVKVSSASGHESDGWSDTVTLTIAEAITAEITATSLVQQTETIEGDTRTYYALKALPMTVTVAGAGANGIVNVVIERAEPYDLERPDEDIFIGHNHETIANESRIGDGVVEIDAPQLIGHLDDGAIYRIVATVQDDLGQVDDTDVIATVNDVEYKTFEVAWTDQALMPNGTVIMDDVNMIATLMPIAPEGVRQTDVCDIYRLSVDKPQLIYEGAEWGTKYVDPYPTIGGYGGYRFVYRTANGDYITEDNRPAWVDVGGGLETDGNIIDFGLDRVTLTFEIELSNSWAKDFQETKYLGGSVQGDWNPAVSRTASMSAVIPVDSDPVMIESIRRLAVHPGICHVRTQDGSSYAADVQVSESYTTGNLHQLASYDLTITRVDSEGFEGMTYDQWLTLHRGHV